MADEELLSRLNQMREHLGVRARPEHAGFESEAVDVATRRAYSLLEDGTFRTGEEIGAHLARKLSVKVEDVRSPEDIKRIEREYIPRGEWAFAQLKIEFSNPDVDALTIRRENHDEDTEERYVAILNHQDDDSRAYINVNHELSHCIAEPAQRDFFHRHKTNLKNLVETIVDGVAFNIGFYDPILLPLIESYETEMLSWDVVESIRTSYAPTASLYSMMLAVIQRWSTPVLILECELRSAKRDPKPKLRIKKVIPNSVALAMQKSLGIFFPRQMRVPKASCAHASWISEGRYDDVEALCDWSTTTGTVAGHGNAFISARPYNGGVLVIVSPMG